MNNLRMIRTSLDNREGEPLVTNYLNTAGRPHGDLRIRRSAGQRLAYTSAGLSRR